MNKYFSEFIGTFAFVFAGIGAIIINDVSVGVIIYLGVRASHIFSDVRNH